MFYPGNLANIQKDMSKAQVIHILGEPDQVMTGHEEERLCYSYSIGSSPVLVDMETSQDFGHRHRNLNTTAEEVRYVVILKDGKVVEYKKQQPK